MKILKYLFLSVCIMLCYTYSSQAQCKHMPQQPTGGPFHAQPRVYIPNYQYRTYPHYNYYEPRYYAPLWNYTPYHLYRPHRSNYLYLIR